MAALERLTANEAPDSREDLLALLADRSGSPTRLCRHAGDDFPGVTLATAVFTAGSPSMELLEAAVRSMQGKKVITGPEPDVDLKSDAWIPADYIEDERERLLEYKRLCDARSNEELGTVLAELEDLYGRPPEPVARFERLIQVKVVCRELKVVLVRRIRGGRLAFTFDAATGVDPGRLMQMVQQHGSRMRLRPEGTLECAMGEDRSDPVVAALGWLEELRATCYQPRARGNS